MFVCLSKTRGSLEVALLVRSWIGLIGLIKTTAIHGSTIEVGKSIYTVIRTRNCSNNLIEIKNLYLTDSINRPLEFWILIKNIYYKIDG